MSTLAGTGTMGSLDGAGNVAQFKHPVGVAVTAAGTVYVAEFINHLIRAVTAGGVVSTLAGSVGVAGFLDASGTAAKFNYPNGVAVDASGTVYVADRQNHRIRKVTAAGVVSTLAGIAGGGFADTVMVVSSDVYTGSALGYADTGLVVGTSYTYTVTAVGPGTTSNTIGPFVP